ncbi:MAG: hypothetical protein JW772_02070 [Candidatus Diapherotrites archaeon]|nr:hypothetical protein [Candidatus Diapherotrites archaeon]
MEKPFIVSSDRFFDHKTVDHPEAPERLTAITETLLENGYKNFEEPEIITDNDLLLVHSQSLIDKIKKLSLEVPEQGVALGDNWFNRNTFEIAKLACGSALKAARLCKKKFAFSIARPPGHHAGISYYGGFCYFNNIAFAAAKIMQEKGYEKTMIVDFDLHHGNGTQNIFQNNENVFYFSLHQDPEHTFPGTGRATENNAHIANVPLEQGTSEEKYLHVFEKGFSKFYSEFKPDLIAVSAGFDIFSRDKFIGNTFQINDAKFFEKIGRIISSAKKPCFGVLEGGYNLETLGECVCNFLNAFD